MGFSPKQAVRVCDDCLEAQQHLTHLRYICCTLDAHLHDQRRANRGVSASVVRRLGRQPEGGGSQAPGTLSSSLKVGLDLLEQGELSEEEFSGLVKAEEGFQKDEAYNRVHAGCLAASARLGDSTLAVVGLLHRGAAAAPWKEFRAVVLHLRMLAEKDLDSIDFFWPQVLHAFYLLVPTVTAEGVFKAELLEDFILAMALRSTHLALKLVWWLKGYVEDLAGESAATPGKGATGKQAHLIRLAVEVEDIVLARADEASSSISSARNDRRGSSGGGDDGGSGGGTDEKESGGGDGGGTAATTAVPGVSLAGSAGAGGASAVARGEGGPEGTTVGETAVAQPNVGVGKKKGNGTTPAIVGALRIEKKGTMPVVPAIDTAPSSPSIEPAARSAVAGGEKTSCRCDGGSANGNYSDGRSSRAGGTGGDTREASPPFERRLLTTLVRPTGAQSSLVGDELLLLRALRAAAAEQLGLDYVAKTRYTSWVESGSGGEEEEEEIERGESEARYFEDQLIFVQSLVDIAERLRFVEPVTARGEHLKRELRQLQKHGDIDYGGDAAAEVVDGSLREEDGRAQAEVGCSSTSGGGSGQGEGSACVSGDSSGKRDGEVHGPGIAVEQGGDAAGSGGPAADAVSPRRKPSDASKEGEGTAAAVVDEKRVDNLGRRGIVRDRCGAGVGVVGAAGGGRGGGGGGPRGFLPVCRATEPICPIVSIPPEEGHVFKTKQRAPTLITCEIIVPQQARRRRRRRPDDGVGYGFEEEGTGGPESANPLPPLSPTALPATAARRASNATGTGAATAGDNGKGIGNGNGNGNGNGGGGSVTQGVGAVGALASQRALPGSGGSSAGGGGGGSAGGVGGVAVVREEGSVTRSRLLPLQRAVSGPGRAGGSVAPGGDGNAASPLRLQWRETSRGSEREEVEEMIESQIEGQGSLGRSIDNKDADGGGSHRSGSGSFGGGSG
ncbi:unnamed protein product, partial [Ectocarpus sp. 12 AP-2014]